MPLQKLQLRPGVNRESTSLANEGTWFEMDKVRFRSGYPEKLGGWVRDTGSASTQNNALAPPTGSFWGVCRALFNWVTIAGFNLMGVGTNLKYYIQQTANGTFYDVTPIRATETVASNAFTTVNTSTTVTVNDIAHGAQANDFVTISGVASAVNGIPAADLNKEFQIVSIVNNNAYTIVVATAATSSGTTGAATFTYQIDTGSDIYTSGVGWGAGGWGGVLSPSASTTLNGALNSSDTTITVISTTGFAASGAIAIEGEYITYSGTTATTFTGCVRGVDSGAASHASGTAVNQYTDATGWGSPAPTGVGIGVQLRLWSQDNFGDYLVMNPRGGALYLWVPGLNPSTYYRAQILSPANTNTQDGVQYFLTDSSCPTVVNIVATSDTSRFVIAFGCNAVGSSTLDPLLIRWSDQENYAVWAPEATNQAGGFRLNIGSSIVAQLQSRQEILVWTDAAVYSMQYLGPPYVWNLQILGDNISIAGPNAVSTASNITYWMGTDKFYRYSGRVETLYCPLRQYIFGDINLSQRYQFFSNTNENYNEIWWFYCSSGSDLIDRYVIFNYVEQTWAYGNLARTAWLDTPLRDKPTAATYGNILVYHENGTDDGSTNPPSPIVSYVQSADFNIGDGHNYGYVWRMIPDITFDGSNVNAPSVTFTMKPRQNPGANYSTSAAAGVTSTQNYQAQRNYIVQQFTQIIYTRIRGRQMAFRVGSDGLGVNWQLGVPSYDVRPDGRR
jgi:hypothetical protein